MGDVRQDGNQIVIDNASIIRRWGTSKGLGEIAAGGPTKTTVLDQAGTIRVHELGVVLRLDCNAEKWAGRNG